MSGLDRVEAVGVPLGVVRRDAKQKKKKKKKKKKKAW